MGIAGMILGILGIIWALIPLATFIPGLDDLTAGVIIAFGLFLAFLCIAVGLPLSGVALYQTRKNQSDVGMSVAGVATNAFTLILIITWIILMAIGSSLTI